MCIFFIPLPYNHRHIEIKPRRKKERKESIFVVILLYFIRGVISFQSLTCSFFFTIFLFFLNFFFSFVTVS